MTSLKNKIQQFFRSASKHGIATVIYERPKSTYRKSFAKVAIMGALCLATVAGVHATFTEKYSEQVTSYVAPHKLIADYKKSLDAMQLDVRRQLSDIRSNAADLLGMFKLGPSQHPDGGPDGMSLVGESDSIPVYISNTNTLGVGLIGIDTQTFGIVFEQGFIDTIGQMFKENPTVHQAVLEFTMDRMANSAHLIQDGSSLDNIREDADTMTALQYIDEGFDANDVQNLIGAAYMAEEAYLLGQTKVADVNALRAHFRDLNETVMQAVHEREQSNAAVNVQNVHSI